MSRYLLLDSGPLGLVTQPRVSPEVVAMNHWLIDCLSSGDAVLVPAIIYYELRRELLRARKVLGLSRLDAFVQGDPTRYCEVVRLISTGREDVHLVDLASKGCERYAS